MLKVRVIPTLLYRDFGLVKGVRFDSRRAVGNPVQAINVYDLRGVDELVFLDVGATIRGSGPDFALVDQLADECFMPLAVGGGVRTVEDIRRLLQVGADKVSLNTAAVEKPELLRDAAGSFGSQSVVASIDVRRDSHGMPTVWIRSGTTPTGRHPVDLAQEMEALGAGEILLTSIDRDGTMDGYDVDLIRDVTSGVSVPVIASGGAGSVQDMGRAVVEGGASAVAAAAIFHFTQHTPADVKRYLRTLGFPVRL